MSQLERSQVFINIHPDDAWSHLKRKLEAETVGRGLRAQGVNIAEVVTVAAQWGSRSGDVVAGYSFSRSEGPVEPKSLWLERNLMQAVRELKKTVS